MSPTRVPARSRALAALGLLVVRCAAPIPPPLPDIGARAEPVAVGLAGVVALALLPDGRLAIAEAGTGAVRTLDPWRPEASAVLVGPGAVAPTGVAVGPEFPRSGRLWLVRGERLHAVVVSSGDPLARTDGGVELPGSAGPVAVGPDSRVYIGIAAGAARGTAIDRWRGTAGGTVIRLNREGTVPVDNPRGPGDPTWASGLAAPAGLALDREGSLWTADSGAGRVVRLTAGDDAGWPLVRGRIDEPFERLAAWEIGAAFPTTAWAPDRSRPYAVAAVRSPEWGASVAVGLGDGRIVRLRADEAGRVRAGPLADGLDGPVVGLVEGPDGRLWAATPGTVWRIDPPGAPAPPRTGVPADTVPPAPPPR